MCGFSLEHRKPSLHVLPVQPAVSGQTYRTVAADARSSGREQRAVAAAEETDEPGWGAAVTAVGAAAAVAGSSG